MLQILKFPCKHLVGPKKGLMFDRISFDNI